MKCYTHLIIFFSCDEGLHFNEATNKCDVPEIAECKYIEFETTPGTGSSTTSGASSSVSETEPESGPEEENPGLPPKIKV